MYRAASRLRGSGCFPRFFVSLRLLGLLGAFSPDDEAQSERFFALNFPDRNRALALFLIERGQHGEEIEGRAIGCGKVQRVPTRSHDEMSTGIQDRPQIAGLGIAAVRDHDLPGLERKARQTLRAMHIGEFDMVYPPGCQVVAGMEPPRRAVGARRTDRTRVDRSQPIPGPRRKS